MAQHERYIGGGRQREGEGGREAGRQREREGEGEREREGGRESEVSSTSNMKHWNIMNPVAAMACSVKTTSLI